MTCSHCCYGCNEKDGRDMPFEMFEMILDKWGERIVKQEIKDIIIGGGEPTVHPDFWKFVSLALSYGVPWIATNGKITEDALLLAKLGKRNTLSAVLSLDEWHEPIDQDVIDVFKNGLVERDHEWVAMNSPDESQGKREIRTIKKPYQRGRCKDGIDRCACSYIRVAPDGLIYGCGCNDATIIGTVLDGFFDKFKNVPWYNTCSLNWDYVVK